LELRRRRQARCQPAGGSAIQAAATAIEDWRSLGYPSCFRKAETVAMVMSSKTTAKKRRQYFKRNGKANEAEEEEETTSIRRGPVFMAVPRVHMSPNNKRDSKDEESPPFMEQGALLSNRDEEGRENMLVQLNYVPDQGRTSSDRISRQTSAMLNRHLITAMVLLAPVMQRIPIAISGKLPHMSLQVGVGKQQMQIKMVLDSGAGENLGKLAFHMAITTERYSSTERAEERYNRAPNKVKVKMLAASSATKWEIEAATVANKGGKIKPVQTGKRPYRPKLPSVYKE
jgi:hypothetical protein